MSLTAATEIYTCAISLRINQHVVQHEAFRGFCVALRAFQKALGERADDTYWKSFTRKLCRYRFDVSGAPLPFDYAYSHGIKDDLASYLKGCESIYPDLAQRARDLVGTFEQLALSGDNPILSALQELYKLAHDRRAAVVLKESRLIPLTEKILSNSQYLGKLPILSPGQVRGDTCYSTIFIVGPSRWFPCSVLTSPRAPEIHVIKYAWVNDELRTEPVFPGSTQGAKLTEAGSHSNELTASERSLVHELTFDPEEFLEVVDWDQVKGKAVTDASGSHPYEEDDGAEQVEARLFLLEGDAAVPLDGSQASKVTVIDLDEDAGARVRRVLVRNIEPGKFILRRTEGGGEYIVEVADRLLGKEALRARETQRHWKSLLRHAVRSSSIGQAASELRRLGSRLAIEANVRNWMSGRSIKTEDYADFQAIMHFVGLGSKSEDYWKTMSMIDNAHRRAGHLISKRLLQQVLLSDVRELERLGRMNFALPEAGSITAFRVRSIYPETIMVPESRLGRVFQVDAG